MISKIHAENRAWNEAAAEKCRQDPELRAMEEAGVWCNLCAMHHPCVCDMQEIAAKLRAYYNSQITTDWLGRSKETVVRSCSLSDRVMSKLASIAIEEFEKKMGRSDVIWGNQDKRKK